MEQYGHGEFRGQYMVIDVPVFVSCFPFTVRIARLVVPGNAHHVTQRGVRRMETFFSDEDCQAYIAHVAEGCKKAGTEVWAYCLMPNHVHLILVPQSGIPEFRAHNT